MPCYRVGIICRRMPFPQWPCCIGSSTRSGLLWELNHSNSNVLAIKGVVPRPPVSVDRASSPFATAVGSTSSTSRLKVSPAPVVASSSCVETLQRFAPAAGFSSRVAQQLGRSRRSSSLTVYQSKWAVYRCWCRDKGHSSSSPSIPKIAEFLPWLWRSKGLSLAAVKAYRSMLSAVFSLKLPDI